MVLIRTVGRTVGRPVGRTTLSKLRPQDTRTTRIPIGGTPVVTLGVVLVVLEVILVVLKV